MSMKIKQTLAGALALLFVSVAAFGADDAGGMVKVKKWKADPVELFDKPDGKMVETKPAAELPTDAERAGNGWLKLKVGNRELFVDSSQARTDLKLTGKPKCDNLGGATGYAASRGYGEEGCEP